MVLKLPPLEFTEALTDSPEFREKLRQHENELENTSNSIKTLLKKLNEVMTANKSRISSPIVRLQSSPSRRFIQSIARCC